MRRVLLFIIPALFLTTSTFPQETTARMLLSDSLKDCSEIQYAAMQLIPLYYQDGMADSANLLLTYWERHCGSDETTYRTHVLWAIDNGTFSDSLIGNETIGNLDTYLLFAGDTTGESLNDYYYYTPEFALLKWYQAFTGSIAKRALGYSDLSSEERFFVNFYLNPSDSLYSLIENQEYEKSQLNKIYTQPIGGVLTEWLFHGAVTGGVWMPEDKLATLGMHPLLGGYAGVRYRKMVYNLGINFRIGSALNTFDVVYKDSLYSSDNFMGINFSLEAGRQLINWRRHELVVLGGIDLEMLKVLTLKNDPDNESDDESKNLFSPSVHIGAGYRYYLKNDRYIGLSSRYHLLNFDNTGGTNLRGNAVTITFEYGYGANARLHNKNTYLKERLRSTY